MNDLINIPIKSLFGLFFFLILDILYFIESDPLIEF